MAYPFDQLEKVVHDKSIIEKTFILLKMQHIQHQPSFQPVLCSAMIGSLLHMRTRPLLRDTRCSYSVTFQQLFSCAVSFLKYRRRGRHDLTQIVEHNVCSYDLLSTRDKFKACYCAFKRRRPVASAVSLFEYTVDAGRRNVLRRVFLSLPPPLTCSSRALRMTPTTWTCTSWTTGCESPA